MSEQLEELLTKWGFTEDIEEFLHFNLDQETILYLNDEQLEKIFDGNMGKIIKFKICSARYIKENVCAVFLHIN